MSSARVAGLLLSLLSSKLSASTIVVDPIDTRTLTTVHLGIDNLSLENSGGSSGVLSADSSVFLTEGGFLPTFSQGRSIPAAGQQRRTSVIYLFVIQNPFFISVSFSGGAESGINYIRADLDQNFVYETVFELDFNGTESRLDDVFTRFAYDSSGQSLDIPEAIAALNGVPEPTSLVFASIGSLLLLRRSRF